MCIKYELEEQGSHKVVSVMTIEFDLPFWLVYRRQNIYRISAEDDISYYQFVYTEKMRRICVDFLMRYLQLAKSLIYTNLSLSL